MKRILFPTDFSENANQALQFALQIAKDFNAELHIINTYQIPFVTAAPTAYSLLDALKNNSVDELNNCLTSIKSDPNYKNLEIITEAISGDLLNAISEIESNSEIDLIVIGTKGASGMKEILIGSNAEQIVYHSKTSVLVVPEMTKGFSFENVVLATDLKPISDTSIFKTFLKLCKKYCKEIKVAYVEQPNNLAMEISKQKIKTTELLNENNHSFHTINNTNIIEGLDNFIKENNSNIIALFSRKYSFFESIFHKSISNKLTCHTKIPIFVIKEK